MKIKFFCPRWGSEHLPWNEFAQKAREAGFDGIESGIPFEQSEKQEIKDALHANGLALIGQYYQSFAKDFELHKEHFKLHLENIASMKPLLIVSQTGKDYFSNDQNGHLFRMAGEIMSGLGIAISHETHRNKALFAAHIAQRLLEQNEQMKITADFSHWCNVSESLLEDQQDAVGLAISRAVHIHSRVGWQQSAQVSDPRAPEFKAALDAHLGWWDKIVSSRAKEGAALLTITTEFGPIPYMQSIPFSNIPVKDQWGINLHMLHLLKDRYSEFI